MPYGHGAAERELRLTGARSEQAREEPFSIVAGGSVADKVAFAPIANGCHRLLKQGRLPEHSALARRPTVERLHTVRAWNEGTKTAANVERMGVVGLSEGNRDGVDDKLVVAHTHALLAAISELTARQHVECAESLRSAEGPGSNGESSSFGAKKSRDSICSTSWNCQPELLLRSVTPALRRQRISGFAPGRHSLVQRMSRQLRRSPSCTGPRAKEAVQSAAVYQAERLPAQDQSETQMGMSQRHQLQSGGGIRESLVRLPLETAAGWPLGTELQPDRGQSGEIAPNDLRVEACPAIPRCVEARRIVEECRFQAPWRQTGKWGPEISGFHLNARLRLDFVGIPESTVQCEPAFRLRYILRIDREVLFANFRIAKVVNAQKIPIQLERR
jgi:hypothetical protein